MIPEDLKGEVRYISPAAMNQVRRRLIILDQLEMQAADVRSAMMAVIADDANIDLEQETWAIDLDHGCVIKQEAPEASEPA